jgi:hypothetical protein
MVVLLVSAFDAESTVNEKAIELCYSHIFKHIASPSDELDVWDSLKSLNAEHIRLLRKVCSLLHAKKYINAKIVTKVTKKLKEDPTRVCSYCILSVHVLTVFRLHGIF